MTRPAHDKDDGARPFVDFYQTLRISPVGQDISDLHKHFGRRDFLYRSLGLAPVTFSGRTVLELGPGSGHNALYVASRGPSRYVLVDANPTGLNQTRSLLTESVAPSPAFDFVLSDILDFRTETRFDIVLCEGVIPHQKDPPAFARHVARLTKPGGVLVVTTADHIGIFPEVLRRVIAACLVSRQWPAPRQIAALYPIMNEHLQSLAGRSRGTEDWILDNILNPWRGRLFGIDEAIAALAHDFDVYGSSPRIFTDWRWYKDIFSGQQRMNEYARETYERVRLSFLDYRSPPVFADASVTREVDSLTRDVFAAMIEIEQAGDLGLLPTVAATVERVSELVSEPLPATARGLREVAAYLRNPAAADPRSAFPEFKGCFGRSQQYLSFIRTPIY